MAWPIISLILTLPILAGIYHRNHELSWGASVTAYVAVLYALGVFAFTQYPIPANPTRFCATHHYGPQLNLWLFIPQLLHGGLFDVLQLACNVVFFIPMGFMLQRWAKWPWWISILFAFGCSVFIETTQLTGLWGIYPCAYRHFDVDDMLTNTTGAVIGYALGALYTHFVPQHAHRTVGLVRQPGLVHRTVSFVIDMLITGIVYAMLAMFWMWLFTRMVVPLNDGTFMLLHQRVGIRLMQLGVWLCGAVAFLVFELVIPARHGGRTLGGMYTHMTVETKLRHGMKRVMFYLVRTAIRGAMFMLAIMFKTFVFWIMAFLLVFWIVARHMPWDYIPADTGRARSRGGSRGELRDGRHDNHAASVSNTAGGDVREHAREHADTGVIER
ncbi:VanZ family protein [Bifidobacterium gallicum]|uniref:VanZ family protein n=1 Tax=Bifidobacterium gallicum TaxID=78342 RepID=UPI000A5D8DC0|nr:VanZ family protein [Bifidobacterium gallicum]